MKMHTIGVWMITMAVSGGLLWASPTTALAANTPPAPKVEAAKSPRATIKTKFGDMELTFFPHKAPRHVENFLKLSKARYYNGTIFHRVIPGFMIQGGDPNTKDPSKPETYGMGGPSERVMAEFNDIPHKRGILSIARSNVANEFGGQNCVRVVA